MGMYRPTNRQVPLLSPAHHLSERSRARLAGSWAPTFRSEILPQLLASEGEFRDLYCADNGRPTWSVARKLGICLLQEVFDLDDQTALDALSFDARWQYALEVGPEEAYLSRRSLVEFRSLLVSRDPTMERMRRLFDRIAATGIERLKLSVRDQRIDSTHIVSNIRVRGRRELFSATLDLALRQAEAVRAGVLEGLPEDVRAWFNEEMPSDDSFAWSDRAHGTPIETLAGWMLSFVEMFREDAEIAALPGYGMVQRLLDEHCAITPSPKEPGESGDGETSIAGDRVQVLPKARKPVSQCLQSPFDPDVGRGHKGTGYEVQVVETCGNTATEIITDFDVLPSGIQDAHQAPAALARLDRRGNKPDRLFADAGYVNGPSLADAEVRGVDLYGPISRGKLEEDAIGREEFMFDEDGHVVACPMGQRVSRRGTRRRLGKVQPMAYFDGHACETCPREASCPAQPDSNTTRLRRLPDRPDLRLRDRRLAEQRTPEWRIHYRIRSGIEATNSELKRVHGLGRLRVRRKARVRLSVTLKLTACNVKRIMHAP